MAAVSTAARCQIAAIPAAATPAAAISGVVRDAHGTPQMGALVQVISLQAGEAALASDAALAGMAYTDLHGHYMIPGISPGKYQLKATEALFLPTLRENLQLRAGAQAVVNVTLSTLFEAVQWLPAQKRKADEPSDDWKWTLRSAANRPILRMLEDGPLVNVSTSNEQQKPSLQARVAVESGDGGFGYGGIHNVFTVDRVLADGTGVILRADLGSQQSFSYPAGASADLTAGYQRKVNPMNTMRSVVSYQSHPEIANGRGLGGLQVLTMQNAEQTMLGDMLALEAGSELTAVRMGGDGMALRPFAKITMHPSDDVLVAYRVATARDLQGWEDMDAVQPEIPVAVMQPGANGRGGLHLEQGLHQEISLSRKTGRGLVQAAYYQDRMANPVISGGGILSGIDIAAGNVMADPATGNFRMFGPGYSANGLRFTVTEPLTQTMWAVLEYTSGSALAMGQGIGQASGQAAGQGLLQTGTGMSSQPWAESIRTANVGAFHTAAANDSLQAAAAGLGVESASSFTVALRGEVVHSGTHLRAAYRWQPESTVTAVDPYNAFSDQPYFSFYIRQPLHCRHVIPHGVEALVDVTNLLAQGYHPVLSSDGHTLFFAQSPRVLEGGLSFNF